MRLWSLHPKYLDAKGLVALWREALLAQNVLLGRTKGYKNHPQLLRFKQCEDPAKAIACYLGDVVDEADRRGYRFNRGKIVREGECATLSVQRGQLAYEFAHLLHKLKQRNPDRYKALESLQEIETHPLFSAIAGDVEAWEVISTATP
ncbi:pyrimidine dimer DNA glycosylase/endonuclease V [Sulfurimonas sp. HSL-3221]|uniref:pyrimidine dimer DNA glycosylase/endonuclease V n=1 Tax=Sulfurimonadaceae TaxID=2771471 RepID=UPI001E321FA3|nr:pyrimidine dimer DNA glycosylase/endonuclease V [Sulfurimonas sp. HSL-3221]UFS63669.1 pyrimidine dimer DNA glycosylase/endonuclease V [Sulfurimonas sp. HSL-3221]